MPDMKTISIPDKSKYRIFHIEMPGCIINIRPYLQASDGHPLVNIEVIVDKQKGEEWDIEGEHNETSHHSIRITQRKLDNGHIHSPETLQNRLIAELAQWVEKNGLNAMASVVTGALNKAGVGVAPNGRLNFSSAENALAVVAQDDPELTAYIESEKFAAELFIPTHPEREYWYAHYGYTDDDTAAEDDPRWRVPYVTRLEEAAKVDPRTNEPELSDTWEDSGPFDTRDEAWAKAKEIAKREYLDSWGT